MQPIYATLILVAIAVAGGTLIFVFSQGFFNTETAEQPVIQTPVEPIHEEIRITEEFSLLADAAYDDCVELFEHDPDYIATCYLKTVHAIDEIMQTDEHTQLINRVDKMKADCSTIYQDPEFIAQCEAGADMIKFGLEMPIP